MAQLDNAPKEHVQALIKRANELQAAAKFNGALELWDKALRLDPKSASLHYNRANTLLLSGNPKDAINGYRKAIGLKPDHFNARLNLTKALFDDGQTAKATKAIDDAAGQLPHDNAALHLAVGQWYARLERQDKARGHLETALEIEPANIQAREDLIAVLAQLGEKDGAVSQCRSLIAQGHKSGRIYHLLARLAPADMQPSEVDAMTTLTRDRNAPVADRRMTCFALGRYHERHGDADRAFQWFDSGNALRKSTHDPRQHADYCTRLIEAWTHEKIETLSRSGSDSTRPVFIVGMPRSGTTLCEQIIAAHPDACWCR